MSPGDTTNPQIGQVCRTEAKYVLARKCLADWRPRVDRPINDTMATNVLVVDDEASDREFLRLWLEGWGYTVRLAGSATEALGAMLIEPAPIILCDIRMPTHDGLWFVDEVRAKWPRTAIVMATAVDDPQTVLRAQRAGVVDYVTKPLDATLLRQALSRANDAVMGRR